MNIGSKLKNIFNNKEKDNYSSEGNSSQYSNKDILLNLKARSSKMTKLYEKLTPQKKNQIDKLTTSELCSIIKEFIPHFTNFNFDISEAIDMIVEISTRYKVQKEKISYFVTMLNSCVFSIKNKLYNKESERKNKKNCLNTSKTNDYKINILMMSMNYLSGSDVINLMSLNKNISSKMSKKIYKNLLHGDIDIKSRLEIWKSILKFVRI